MVVILFHNQVGGVEVVHPGGDLFQILRLAGDGVDQNGPLNVGAAEQANGFDDARCNPPGLARFVNFKPRLREQIGGIFKAQVPVDVPVQRFGFGVLHPLIQPDDLGFLRDHVHQNVGGQALIPVGEPLDEVGVVDGGHAHGAALVIDLGRVVGILKLADHIAQGAHLAVTQIIGRVTVQRWNLVEGDLGDVGGEITGLHVQKLLVSAGPEDGQRQHLAHQSDQNQRHKEQQNRQALLFEALHKIAEKVFRSGLLIGRDPEPGGDQRANHKNNTEQPGEGIKFRVFQIDGGQADVKVGEAHKKGDGQAPQNLPEAAMGKDASSLFQNNSSQMAGRRCKRLPQAVCPLYGGGKLGQNNPCEPYYTGFFCREQFRSCGKTMKIL